jgi:putative ABC transport system permease protein
MIHFLLKGILRDKNRSLLPFIIVTMGAALTILLSGYIRGAMGDVIDQNARFDTGHVKIMTRAYLQNKDQLPNDLALMGVDTLMESLTTSFSEIRWVKRIRFGGLLDVPDEQGETKAQGPALGMALELFDEGSGEVDRLNIQSSLKSGALPKKRGEVLIGEDFAYKLGLRPGEEVTYVGSTIYGSLTFKTFTISGTVRFGASSMDKGAIIVDISDARKMLDMEDGAGEILGFLNDGVYLDEKAQAVSARFNSRYQNTKDEFAPVMVPLKEQNNLKGYLDYVDMFSVLFITIFVFAMSLVLWNTGLLGGLRRYQEFGIRLAMGEEKGHIYRSLVWEAILIGLMGSVAGTFVGLAGTLYLQIHGIDISGLLTDATMMMPSVLRARITPGLFYIGFIPGLAAMVLGTGLAGLGIYRRETAVLFKELEV